RARVAEAPAQHLGHRREVVRALDGADAVAAVAVLVGRPLVEGDDGAHGLAALEGRDVEAFDALGRVGEAEPRLQLGRHALALLRRVAPLGEALPRVVARHLDRAELVGAPWNGDRVDLAALRGRLLARSAAGSVSDWVGY